MAEPSVQVIAEPEPLPPPAGPGEDAPKAEQQPMSKNALKKAAKAERLAAVKQERRAREKQAKKEKKRQRAEKRAAGELEDEEEERRKRAKRPRLEFGGTVLVDLGFDDMMSEKEVKSLCSQLAYTHSVNRNASFPFTLIFSSVNGRTYQRLESLSDASYKRWANTHWWSEGYDRLWKGPTTSSTGGSKSTGADAALPDNAQAAESSPEDQEEGVDPHRPSVDSTADNPVGEALKIPQDKVVYLTADTEEELSELKPDEVYIIGGICDHNRYKNLCLNKAKESGVRTARLPIGRYLASLPTRKVLTVNQVFEILVKWVETKDWEESLYAVIPKRKFQQGKKGNHDANIDAAAVEDDADADETGQQGGEDETL
ncbi:hypothetical protein CVT26_009530 [Gymnopilus dilepis]|uniref:tRNA (guanine(9)-N1)-methyltransferase n=1 Tax=Gymnopilus dilepis TaxID=231916 RepID=A0A409VKC5_9AGAR|nr:hypothetical protein CVT26_009530 [Gymnopilus dilepis]